jgi:hypothetical protein
MPVDRDNRIGVGSILKAGAHMGRSIFQSKNDTEIENRFQYKMILKSKGWGASSAQDSPGVGNGLEQRFQEFGADQREARHSLKRAFRERPFPHIR